MNQNVQFIANSDRCYGCGSCSARCPQHCIRMTPDGENFDYPSIDFEQCTHCNRCMGNCPVNDASLHLRPDMTTRFFRASPLRPEPNAVDALFVALSDAVLRRGGAVCGAVAEDDFQMTHRIVFDRAGRDRMKGFHYLQSKVTPVYLKIKQLLGENKLLLFAGTPCEVAGLHAYLGHNHENLITLDSFCHGRVSPLFFQGYLDFLAKEHHSRPVSVELRDPAAPSGEKELKITFADGTVKALPRGRDLFVRLFREQLVLRPCCDHCPFAGIEREADLSIAEFPGETNTALAAVNTNRGYELLSEIVDDFELHSCKPDEFDLEKLLKVPAAHPDREAFHRSFLRRGFAAAARSFARPRPWRRKLQHWLWNLILTLAGRKQS